MQKGVNKELFKRGVARARKRAGPKLRHKLVHKRRGTGHNPRRRSHKTVGALPWRRRERRARRAGPEKLIPLYASVLNGWSDRQLRRKRRRGWQDVVVGHWKWSDRQQRWVWYPVPGTEYCPSEAWLNGNRPKEAPCR